MKEKTKNIYGLPFLRAIFNANLLQKSSLECPQLAREKGRERL